MRHTYIALGLLVVLIISTHTQIARAEDATDSARDQTQTIGKPTLEEIQTRKDTIAAERKARLETVTENRDALKAERAQMTAERAAKQEEIKAQITERKLELITNRKERATEFLRRASERLDHIANNLDSVIVRLETRLTEAKTTVDTDTAHEEIASAQTSLDEARSMIVALPDLADTLGDESTAQDAITHVKSEIKAIQDKLKEVHTHLMLAVRSVKSTNSGRIQTATSTTE